jgi:CHAD domain-containing protein
MKYRPDDCTCQFGAAIILQNLDALLIEVDGVLLGQDIEYIHRMRVSSRRLRAAIPIFKDCFPPKQVRLWQNNIRDITRALGEARDRDVQLDLLDGFLKENIDPKIKLGIRRITMRLAQQRKALQNDVNQSIHIFNESGVAENIKVLLAPLAEQNATNFPFTYALYQIAADTIRGALDLLLSHEAYIFDPANIAELHQMRISAKRLRYILEVFSSLYADQLKPFIQTIKKCQDQLGEIHDCDVWLDFIPAFIEEERLRIISYFDNPGPINRFLPGINYFHDNRVTVRNSLYRSFLNEWEEFNALGIWQKLRDTFERPVQPFGEFYPPTWNYFSEQIVSGTDQDLNQLDE